MTHCAHAAASHQRSRQRHHCDCLHRHELSFQAKSGVGVAERAGAAKPDISSPEAFKRPLLAAIPIAYTATGASCIYFAGVTEKMGIGAEVKAKAKTPSGGHVAELVAKGEAEMAVQMINELRGVPGADYVGPLPGDLQVFTVFSAGLLPGAKQTEAALALIRFLTTPDAARVYLSNGMEPGCVPYGNDNENGNEYEHATHSPRRPG